MQHSSTPEMFANAQIGSISGGSFNAANTINISNPAPSSSVRTGPTLPLEKLVQWLSSINFRAVQKENFKKYTVGTGLWLLSHEEFLGWKEGLWRTFWITGMPGSGKTILTSLLNNTLEKEYHSNPDVLLLIAICRYDNKLTARDVFAALVRQIADSAKDERVLACLYAFYERHKTQDTTPDTSDFVELLQEIFQFYELVIGSLDALDEMDEEAREELLDALRKLEISLFITSRPTMEHFKETLDGVYSLRLEDVSTVQGDIELYIRTKLTTVPRFKAIIGGDKNLLEVVCGTLVQRSAGMFLLSWLHLEELRRLNTAQQVLDAINHLPSDLFAMYRTTWRRIISQNLADAAMAKAVFVWILYAVPGYDFHYPTDGDLLLPFLLQALGVDIRSRTYTPGVRASRALVEAACGGLISIEKKDMRSPDGGSISFETVRLAHYTTRDFFGGLQSYFKHDKLLAYRLPNVTSAGIGI